MQDHTTEFSASKEHKSSLKVFKERIDILRDKYLSDFVTLKTSQLSEVIPSQCSYVCPFYSSCKSRDKKEEGICKREQELFNTSLHGYVVELEVDPNRPTEIVSVAELATIDVLEARCYEMLAKDGILVETLTGMDAHDSPIFEKTDHPVFKILELLWRRRSQIKRELTATREQKAKFMAELSRKMSPVELMSKLREEARKRDKLQVIEAEVVEKKK